MKAYTDIEQSKKLAKILPIESADMWYDNDGRSTAGRPEVRCGSFIGLDSKNIPCWSLAALIDILPDNLIINECSAVLWIGKKHVCYYRRDDDTSVFEYFTNGDDLLDVIVEMIVKLKKGNLI